MTGYSGIGDALKGDNYQFDKLVLAQTNMIPADATEIVIAGPKTDLLDSEIPLITEYLAKGGKLLVMLDPPDDLKKSVPMPRLQGLLKDWGINTPDTIVVDVSGRTTVATVPVAAPPYPTHPDHAAVRAGDDVPRGSSDHAGDRQSTARSTVVRADRRAELGRDDVLRAR